MNSATVISLTVAILAASIALLAQVYQIISSSLNEAETWTGNRNSPAKTGCHFVSICN